MKKTLSMTLIIGITIISLNSQAGILRDRIMARMTENHEMEDGSENNGQAINLPTNTMVKRNIAYGTDEAQRMDVYIPANAQHAPVMLMVHGGGWRRGDKAMSRVVENKVKRWLPKGLIFVSVNYRMLPKADPLVQANDVALALAKAQSLAPDWGGDSQRFILMGHSAGAHLIALITANPDIIHQQGAQPWLATIMLDSGGYDIEKTMSSHHFSLYDQTFGSDPKFWQSTSPSYQLKQKTVPILAVCSTQRKDQPCKQAQAFIDKAQSFGSQASLLPEAMSHGEINAHLGLESEYTNKVEEFMQSVGIQLR